MPQGAFPLTTVNEGCLEGWDTEIWSTTPTTPTETTHETINATATTTGSTTTTATPTTTTTMVGTTCTDSAAVLAKPDLLMAVLIVLVLGLAK